MHLVAKNGLRVRAGVEIEFLRAVAKIILQRLDQLVAIDLERIFVGPDPAHQLEPGILARGLYRQHAAARTQASDQWREYVFDLELGTHARTPGLRRQHQVIIATGGLPAFWNNAVEQKAVILAKYHQHRRTHVHRIAGFLVRLDLPAVDQLLVDAAQLFTEFMRRCSLQRHFDPVQRGRLGDIVRHQPGRLGIIQIGNHDHAGRMLDKAVGQFLQRQANILQADLLADDEKGNSREAPMHRAHQMPEDGAVADTGIEQPQGRRRGANMRQLLGRALGNLPLFVAGVDEGQVFLPIIIKSKRPVVGNVRHLFTPR